MHITQDCKKYIIRNPKDKETRNKMKQRILKAFELKTGFKAFRPRPGGAGNSNTGLKLFLLIQKNLNCNI